MNNLIYTGKLEDLECLGNVEGEVPTRKITPEGLIQFKGSGFEFGFLVRGFIFKNYLLEEEDDKLVAKEELERIKPLLIYDFKELIWRPEYMESNPSGLGFSILSKGMFNANRWEKDVPVPRIYTLKNGVWKPQEVERVGSFCSGEKRVYDHENEAWLRYLNSSRTNEDKVQYLNDFLVEE